MAYSGIVRHHGNLAPFAVEGLVLRRVGQQIPVLHVRRQHVVNDLQLGLATRQKRTTAGFLRQAPEEALALERNPRDAADADDVHRRADILDRGERILELAGAVLVVAIGDQDNRATALEAAEMRRQLDERVENCRSAARLDLRDGIEHRVAIIGGTGDRLQRLGERDDQHPVFRPHVADQSVRGFAHEIDSTRHALAAVHEHRKRRRQVILPGEVERLRHPILEHGEVLMGEVANELAVLVLDDGVEQDATDLGEIGDLETFENDRVGGGVAEIVPDRHGDFGRHERVLIHPFRRVRRSTLDCCEELAVHEELNRGQRAVRERPDLGDDTDGRDLSGATHRRGDSSRQLGGRLAVLAVFLFWPFWLRLGPSGRVGRGRLDVGGRRCCQRFDTRDRFLAGRHVGAHQHHKGR